MINERKHIDNFFADSLEEHVVDNLDLDLNWNAVDKGLNKYSFFRFQTNRFNIYYLGAICLNVAILCWIWTYKVGHPVVLDRNESSKVSDGSNGTLKADLSTLPSTSNSKSNKIFSSGPKSSQQNGAVSKGADTSLVDSNNLKVQEDLITDFINAAELQKKPDSLGSKKIKPPAIITRKRDTIIQVDTVFVNKKKKK